MLSKTTIVLLAVVGLAAAMPGREKRQASGCLSSFQNVPNVCQTSPTGQVFFPHPSDLTKFLQCDVSKRMYIIQCPVGEVFNVASNACQPLSVPQKTPTSATTTPPPLTTVKQMVPHLPGVNLPNNKSNNNNSSNPCTPQNLALGKLYFPFAGDKTKFYQCDLQGHANVLTCPVNQQWDQKILSCVYPLIAVPQPTLTVAGVPQTAPTVKLPSGHPNNPCTAQALAAGRMYFPHPDQHKYIQCDLWGDAFTNSCPTNLVWNAYLQTCTSSMLQGPVSGRK